MKKIFITGNQLNKIKEDKENREIPFEEFFTSAKDFLKDLLTCPYEAELPSLFKELHITKDELIEKMKKLGLLKSKENIIEVPVTEEKLRAKHTIQYKIPRNRFMDKLRELHKELCETTIVKSVFDNEDDEINNIIADDEKYGGWYSRCGGLGRGYEKD